MIGEKRFVWLVVASTIVAPVALAHATAPLTYVESSTGLDVIRWESGPTEVELADLNGDGDLDIVSIGDHGNPLVNSEEQGLMVWFGDGTGTWPSFFQTGNFGYGGIAVGDLNGDGAADVAYGMHHDYSSSDFGDQLIEAALGDGTGRAWTPWDDGLAENGESWGMFGTDLGDVDNDGDLDLASLSFGAGNGVHVYRNGGDGTWTQSFARIGDNSNSNDIVFGDVDADGNLDFAAGYQNGTVWFGDGAGGFSLGDGNLPGQGFWERSGVDLGDVDGDGQDDLSFVNGDGGVEVWIHAGGGSWTSASAGLPVSGGFDATQLRDLNGDGSIDLAACGSGAVSTFLGNGGSSWVSGPSFGVGNPGRCRAFRAGGDPDRNGRPDFVVVADERVDIFNTQNHLRFFREGSIPAELAVRPVRPRGGESLPEGSVRPIEWISAVPIGEISTVRIEYSTSGTSGPWILVAEDEPDDGIFLWTVPTGAASDRVHIRYTVSTTSGASVSANNVAPFSVVVSDSDGDGVPNWQDCAPGDAGTFHEPHPVTGVRVERDAIDPEVSVLVRWDDGSASAGPGLVYDVVSGAVFGLGPDGVLTGATCRSDDHPETQLSFSLALTPGECHWILIRSENSCGISSWGHSSGGVERTSSACSP